MRLLDLEALEANQSRRLAANTSGRGRQAPLRKINISPGDGRVRALTVVIQFSHLQINNGGRMWRPT
jgi:hypothetical protein